MPLFEYTGVLGYKRAAHLLHRASFGPTKDEIDSFATLTPAVAVAKLFQQPLPDPVLPIDPETSREWFISGTTDANSGDSDLQEFFKGWFISPHAKRWCSSSTPCSPPFSQKLITVALCTLRINSTASSRLIKLLA